jgi:cyclic-di-AMP phosphodiesterase PgpH
MGTPPSDPPAPRAAARRSSLLASLRIHLASATEKLLANRSVWSLIFVACLVPLMAGPGPGPALPVPAVGATVSADIIAPSTLEMVDQPATSDLRAAAAAAVLPVYDLNPGALKDSLSTVHRLFEQGRRMDAATGPMAQGALPGRSAQGPKERMEIQVPRETLTYLSAGRFSPDIEDRLVRVLQAVFAHRIVGSRSGLPRAGRIMLRESSDLVESRIERLDDPLSLSEARELAAETHRTAGAGSAERRALQPLLSDLIVPTLTYNGSVTETRRQEAAARIEPLLLRLPKGKTLMRAGEVVSEETARTLRAFNDARDPTVRGRVLLANMLFSCLLLFFMSRYVFFYQNSYRNERHLFALMIVLTVLSLALDEGFVWVYGHVVGNLKVESYADPALARAMMPVAVGAMLTTLLANARVGMAYVLFYVPLFGMMTGWDLPLVLFALISNLAAIYGIGAYDRRSSLVRAGLVVGGVNMVVVLALLILSGRMSPLSAVSMQMLSGFAGGILVSVLVSFLLPILESLFNVLTDVRLLELSNLNNPLLRRLAVEAPGSYNHSVIVGTLAEAAAESIGANALFCRVAAYYHDVGKMLKPDYFIENQRADGNRHDGLSPHLSAIVIASHVKEGYELARSYGLPKQVLDIIPQHHGTRKINYFFQKAKRDEDPKVEEIQESDFRYPGPKPQTREAAIFMLSDSIEAAARTLEDPSPARFKGLIRKIVSDIVLDDQFSESDLSFSELEKVSASFLRTLSSIYHHRIDYPGFDFDRVSERPFGGSRSHENLPSHRKGWIR